MDKGKIEVGGRAPNWKTSVRNYCSLMLPFGRSVVLLWEKFIWELNWNKRQGMEEVSPSALLMGFFSMLKDILLVQKESQTQVTFRVLWMGKIAVSGKDNMVSRYLIAKAGFSKN